MSEHVVRIRGTEFQYGPTGFYTSYEYDCECSCGWYACEATRPQADEVTDQHLAEVQP